MIILAVLFGAIIGLTLGALGAGGSILAVPVLVHILGLGVHEATATSLVAVGAAALAAALSSGHRHHIRWDIVGWFVAAGALGSIAGAALGRRVDGGLLLIGFSALMLLAAYRMFASNVKASATEGSGASSDRLSKSTPLLERMVVFAIAGVTVGFLTGLFGVGGGFVIVPVLAIFIGLDMPESVATSLAVIAGNAAVAMVVRGVDSVDWPTAGAFTVPMLVGSMGGALLAKRLDQKRSAQAFAVTLVIIAVANAATVVF